MRAKWSAPIRKYWKISEQMMVKYCDLTICDSVNIEKYIHTIRLTAADFLEKLETAVTERSVERMTAMEYAEKLIADKERDKTVFDNSQRNLIVNFAYKLDDRAATEELANNLAAAVTAENTEEINRLMWEAEEKIESLPDGMIGLSEMHEYGYPDQRGRLRLYLI